MKRPKTAVQFVVEALRDEILNGNIKSGYRLTQNELSKRFEVSATPVREALKILSTQGLIIFDEHKGAITKNLSIQKAEEIYLLRVVLEPILIEKAFKFIDDETIKKAEIIYQKSIKTDDINEWVSLNGEFHGIFWDGVRDSMTYQIVENLRLNAYAYIAFSLHLYKSHIKTSNQDHKNLLEFFKKRELENVINLNKKHTLNTLEIIKNTLLKSS